MLAPRLYLERRQAEELELPDGTRLGAAIADGTLRREVGVLRAALNWASRQQPPWIERVPYVEAPPAPPPRDRWLTREEIERLIAACASAHVRLFVLLAYHTAARAGAILELTWDQVDLAGRRIDYHRPGRRRTTKRRATVPLNMIVLTALQAARQAIAGEPGQMHVIQWHGRPLSSIKRGFAAACERAGISDCSPHVLRHTAATHMVLARVPLAEVARMLGDSEAVVEKVYGKHSPDYLRRAADALAGELGPRLVNPKHSEK